MATMGTDLEQARYTRVAIWLHWLTAVLVLFNLATGLTFERMSDKAFAAIVPLHISSGMTVLVLTLARIAWRLAHSPPPLLPMPAWQRRLAAAVYVLFYIAMIAAPMTGWALVSAHPDAPPAAPAIAQPTRPGIAPPPVPARRQTMIWGVVPLPKLAPIVHIGDGPGGGAKLHQAHEAFEQRHGLIGWILLALFALHVAGALKHQFADRRRAFARMGIGHPLLKR